MKNKKLSEIADIKSGYSFRESIDCQTDGDIAVFTAKNICDGESNNSNLAFVGGRQFKADCFLKDGSILMNTRLNFNSALCKNIDTPSIAAAPLLIISVKDETILPEYLNIYINSVECQNYMKSVSCGGAVPFVSANEVCRIEIPMLNIEKQRSIIKFNSLYKKEQYLLSEIVRLRAKMHKQIINNLIFN